MSRDTKLLAGAAVIQIVVAIGKSGAKTPDAVIETAKTEVVPLIFNLGGLFLLLRFIK